MSSKPWLTGSTEVPAPDLRIGDIVRFYGARLEIISMNHEVLRPDGERVVAWNTRDAGSDPEVLADLGQYGKDMKEGRWIIQGNARAIHLVENRS